jgi:Domain of unknown function (DUF4411)
MTRYWLDASVLIDAHRKSYPIKIMASFWVWLNGQIHDGVIVCPRMVYKEIAEVDGRDDELSQWMKVRKGKGLCIAASRAVQREVGNIQVHVYEKYDSVEAWEFSKGADSWVIAHAKVENGIVVTKESTLHPDAKKARIPDVCCHFQVKCIDTLEMLRRLNAKI